MCDRGILLVIWLTVLVITENVGSYFDVVVFYFPDEFYHGEEGVEALTEEGQANLLRFENMLRQGQGDGLPSQNNANTNGNTNGNAEESMFEKNVKLSWAGLNTY